MKKLQANQLIFLLAVWIGNDEVVAKSRIRADDEDELKSYDSLVGTHLVSSAQKFLNASGNGVAEFQDFYIYFQSVKKFK